MSYEAKQILGTIAITVLIIFGLYLIWKVSNGSFDW